jgi:hypothetical protein
MQQHDFDVLIHEEEHGFNSLKREEVVPRYKSISPPYYQEHEDEELEERAQNFERHIHYVVEQEVTTQNIRISEGVELILIIRQGTVILLRAKLTIIEGVHVAVRIRYNEPRLNQHSGSIIRGVPRLGVNEFIMQIEFQDLTLHVAHTTIKLDIRSMNVHLLKIM